MRVNAVLFAAMLSVAPAFAAQSAQSIHNSALLQKAHEAYNAAEALDSDLAAKPEQDKTRAEYLKVIYAYQRVYTITPHTSYADDALMAIARLYEDIHDTTDTIRTLNFLVREYPGTPFKDAAEKELVRLSAGTPQKTAAV